ncbi:anion permease, partial [candidate division KSB1 bacterium]|nr:anion permease [candidate division KSB1 bacterium]
MSYVFLFITGFLISRLSVRYELVEQFFARLFHGRNHSVQRFLFYLLCAAALVSMFTPNFIAALTLLPMLETLRQSFEQNHNEKIARRLTTAIVIIVIYGCNIGGMGSLVGSPANAFMLAQMEIFNVAGREKINFLSWFGWSLPLVGVLLVIAWAQVALLFIPAKFRREQIELPQFHQSLQLHGSAKIAWQMLVLWFAFWTVHSVLQILLPASEPNFILFDLKIGFTRWDQLATVFGVLYLVLLFAPIFRTE